LPGEALCAAPTLLHRLTSKRQIEFCIRADTDFFFFSSLL
jgi:hypothetical protein